MPSAPRVSCSPASMQSQYEISKEDLDRIRAYGKRVVANLEVYVREFYAWLETTPEFAQYFSDPAKLAAVQELQQDYWRDFFRGQIDERFIEGRLIVGTKHAHIGLPLPAYFAAVNKSLGIFLDTMYDGHLSAEEYAHLARAMTRLVNLDTAIVVETFSRLTQQTIAEQGEALMQMSTPVTAIWDDILMLPLVGIIDSKRAQEIMNAMLAAIGETRSKVIIMDISGVAVVDTAVANHLIKITKATKLMGCECTISGVSPAIAQTIVELGIDVGTVKTTATLQDALAQGFRMTGIDMAATRR